MDGIAQWLLDRGLKPGDRIALHRQNSIELVVLMLAAFRAALIAVPINPRLKAAEIASFWNTPARGSVSASQRLPGWSPQLRS